jgi:hypothetical protein
VFLEMAKDMPRARTDALARLWVPMVAVLGVALVAVTAWFVVDARTDPHLDQQVTEQAEASGVVLPRTWTVPTTDGEVEVSLLVDGARTDGVIRVDGDVATLLARDTDGELVPVTDRD